MSTLQPHAVRAVHGAHEQRHHPSAERSEGSEQSNRSADRLPSDTGSIVADANILDLFKGLLISIGLSIFMWIVITFALYFMVTAIVHAA